MLNFDRYVFLSFFKEKLLIVLVGTKIARFRDGLSSQFFFVFFCFCFCFFCGRERVGGGGGLGGGAGRLLRGTKIPATQWNIAFLLN